MEGGTPRKTGLQGQALQAGRKGDTPSREDGLCMAKQDALGDRPAGKQQEMF